MTTWEARQTSRARLGDHVVSLVQPEDIPDGEFAIGMPSGLVNDWMRQAACLDELSGTRGARLVLEVDRHMALAAPARSQAIEVPRGEREEPRQQEAHRERAERRERQERAAQRTAQRFASRAIQRREE